MRIHTYVHAWGTCGDAWPRGRFGQLAQAVVEPIERPLAALQPTRLPPKAGVVQQQAETAHMAGQTDSAHMLLPSTSQQSGQISSRDQQQLPMPQTERSPVTARNHPTCTRTPHLHACTLMHGTASHRTAPHTSMQMLSSNQQAWASGERGQAADVSSVDERHRHIAGIPPNSRSFKKRLLAPDCCVKLLYMTTMY